MIATIIRKEQKTCKQDVQHLIHSTRYGKIEVDNLPVWRNREGWSEPVVVSVAWLKMEYKKWIQAIRIHMVATAGQFFENKVLSLDKQ